MNVAHILSTIASRVPRNCKTGSRWIATLCVGILAWSLCAGSASAQSFNDIQTAFADGTAGWINGAMNVADGLFTFVMGLYIVYTLASAGVDTMRGEQDFGTVLWPIGRAFLWLIAPLAILKVFAYDILPNIIPFAYKLSGLITNDTGGDYRPDAIFDIGFTRAVGFLHATAAPLATQLTLGNAIQGKLDLHQISLGIFELLLGSIVFMIMLGVFAIIACEVLLAYIEVYLTVSIGAINLGWLGSPATAGMADGYIRLVWGSFLRLITVWAFVSLLAHFLSTWEVWTLAVTPDLFMQIAGEVLAVSVASLFLTLRIGALCNKMAGGSAAFTSAGAMAFGRTVFSAAAKGF